MASEWFYSRDGKGKTGPVSSAQLQALAKSGQLKQTDMVWREGMAKWTPASNIKGLFASAGTSSPQRMQPVRPPAPAASDKAPQPRPPVRGNPQRTSYEDSSAGRTGNGKLLLALVGIAAVACAAGITVLVVTHLNSGTPQNTVALNKDKATEQKEPHTDPKDKATEQKEPSTDAKDKTTEKKEPAMKPTKEQPEDKATEKEPSTEQPKDKANEGGGGTGTLNC